MKRKLQNLGVFNLNNAKIGLDDFLEQYPNMIIAPNKSSDLILRGRFEFTAQYLDHPQISDAYELEICIPKSFPSDVPTVKELGNKIPRDGNHHVNSNDDTLCLGSPLRLKIIVQDEKNLLSFVHQCLIPYLYWISSNNFSVGELAHGSDGLLTDYADIFNLGSIEMVVPFLKGLSVRKRVANKEPCPCGCLKRIGKCPQKLNLSLNKFRKVATRTWYKQHLAKFG